MQKCRVFSVPLDLHAEHFLSFCLQRSKMYKNKVLSDVVFFAKMHLYAKMHLVFFYIVKKQSVHFTSKNVFLHVKCYKCIWCKNVFLRTFYKVKCSAYILQSQMFSIRKAKCDAKMYFCKAQ